MNYELDGEGTPIVLITGLMGTVDFWKKTLPLIPERYEVLRMDNRGAGGTACDGDFTIKDMADDVASLMDTVGTGPAHILGWSMGSHIALDLVARYPEKARSLTVVSSYLKRPSRSEYILTAMAEGYHDGSMSEKTVGTFMNVLLRNEEFFRSAEKSGRPIRNMKLGDREGMYRQMRSVNGYDPLEDARSISVPTLSVHGLEDIMAYPSCGDQLADQIRNCVRFRVPGEGHVLRPESYIPVFLEFIDSVDSTKDRIPIL